MTKNIFEGANFGDRFVTRDGHRACLICKSSKSNGNLVACAISYSDCGYIVQSYKNDGTVYDVEDCFDIVSRYQEHVDEDKLDELVWETLKVLNGNRDTVSPDVASMMAGFKIGYRKAMEG